MNNVDAFLVYHLLNGNALRTALTFEVAPETIANLAAAESWDEKIKNYNRPPGDSNELDDWCAFLDAMGIEHTAPAAGHLGQHVEVSDPDCLVIQLHTVGQPAADEACDA